MMTRTCTFSGLCIALVLTAAAHSRADLISHWTFDTDFTDAVGSNGLTPSGSAAITTVAGDVRVGSGALTLDGSGSFATAVGYKGVLGTTPRSVSAWIKTTATGSTNTIVNWGTNDPGERWTFRVDNASGAVLRTEIQSGFTFGTTPLNDGAWHHVVTTWDPADGPNSDHIKLYVDGALQTTTVGSQSINTTPGFDFTVGNDNFSRFFLGQIDDLGLFDRALTEAEVAAIGNLALEPGLAYDLGESNILFALHSAGSGTVTIGDEVWTVASGLSGGLGVVQSIGNQYFLQLGLGGTGVQSVQVIIPEPSALLLLGCGCVGLIFRRARRGRP